MAAMTAQLLVGHPDRHHGGIQPTHVVWLSENGSAAWILQEVWRDIYGEPTGAAEDQEPSQWTDGKIIWGPTEHMLEDAILLVAVCVLRDAECSNWSRAIAKPG
jgi:hypothetical protein